MDKGELFQGTDNPGENDQMVANKFVDHDNDDFSFEAAEEPAPGADAKGDVSDGKFDYDNIEEVEVDFDEMNARQEEEDMLDLDEFTTGDDIFKDIDKKQTEKKEEASAPSENQIELDALNKTFDTDFKTLEEAKAAIKKPVEQAQEVQDIAPEKIQKYEKNNEFIQYLEKQKLKTDRQKAYDHLESKMKRENGGKFDEDDAYSLNEKLDNMENNGGLYSLSEVIGNKIDNAIANLKNENQSIDSEKNQIQETKNQAVKKTLQSHLQERLTGKDFYGVALDPAVTKSAYDSIVTGKIFKDIENNPQVLTDVALFLQTKEIMSKVSSKATYSDGVKAVMSEIVGSKEDVRTTQVKSNPSVAGSDSLRNRFLQ